MEHGQTRVLVSFGVIVRRKHINGSGEMRFTVMEIIYLLILMLVSNFVVQEGCIVRGIKSLMSRFVITSTSEK